MRVPLHRSLVGRLLATSVLVAVCAIVATAWLTVRTTTWAVRQEQGQSLSDDRAAYDALLTYAGGHRDYAAAGPVVGAYARKLDRRITLTDENRRVLADSGTGPLPAGARPSATVDPLAVDIALTGGTARIDPRAVGPYLLPPAERDRLHALAAQQVACMKIRSVEAEIVDGPSGRPTVVAVSIDNKGARTTCLNDIVKPTATEKAPLAALEQLTASCLGIAPDLVIIQPDFSVWITAASGGFDTERTEKARDCVTVSRITQLRLYVAGPALLFVTSPDVGAGQPVLDLSRANVVRVAMVTGTVLLLAVLSTVLAGRRLVRPLQALTDAARRPTGGRMPVSGHDEIGYLATALNELSDRRDQVEQQRTAMVNDVAHELRSPLTNIRGWLEAANDGLTPADPRLLSLLLDEAALLQHIIDDLRDLAAADAGSLRIHPEPTYVDDLLAQVVDAARSAAAEGGVRLEAELAGDPELCVDPSRIRQLAGNLLSNAIRHTPAGGTVTVRSWLGPDGWTFAVTDTGTGIAAQDLPRIFDRFWRADASRSRATGGSGLGLSIARQLARAHHGDIGVTSTPGVGTCFTVRIAVGPTVRIDSSRC